MKILEIIEERRNNKQLNEALPLIGGVAFATILAYVSAALTGYTVVQLIKFISNYNKDPEAITDEQWSDMFWDVATLALPMIGSAAVKLAPASVKKWAGNWMKGKVLAKLKTDRAAIAASGAKAPIKLKLSAKATAKAKNKIAKFPKNIYKMIVTGGLLSYALDYWSKYFEVIDQWDAYTKGDKTTEIFANADNPAKAERIKNELLDRYIGELTAGVALTVAAIPSAALVTIAAGLLGTISGGAITGGLFAITGAIASKLVKIGGPGIVLFLQTPTGKEFLNSSFISMITGAIGSGVATLSTATANLLSKGLDAFIITAASIIPGAGEWGKKYAADREAEAAASAKTDAAAAAAAKADRAIPNSLKIMYQTDNPKVLYIGGVQITDENGLQVVGNQYLNKIKDEFRVMNLPFPADKIKPNPNLSF